VFDAASSARRTDAEEWRALSAWGYTLLGDEKLAEGKLEAAERHYRDALDKMEATAAAHFGLARLHARAGRAAEARAALDRATALDAALREKAATEADLAGLVPPR
jgi:tetratricopeptide (TPR) repeat protein